MLNLNIYILDARCMKIHAGWAFLTQPGATILPPHTAQRPGAAGVVQNTCIIAVVIMQVPCPWPLNSHVCKLTRHLCGVNLHTPG